MPLDVHTPYTHTHTKFVDSGLWKFISFFNTHQKTDGSFKGTFGREQQRPKPHQTAQQFGNNKILKLN